MTRLILLALGMLLGCTLQVQAADQPLSKSSDQPIEVTAQQLEALQQQGKAIFTGEVVAKQGDITLYCKKMVVYTQSGKQQVDRLEAFGGVRVVQLDRTATADQAIYRQRQRTLVLVGNAELHQGQNHVAGDEITVFLDENRSIVKSQGGHRVRAVLFPQTKQASQ